MSAIFRITFVLVLGLMLVGCNSTSAQADKLWKRQIAMKNEIAAEMEKVTDKASAEAVGKATAEIQEKYKEDTAAWGAMPAEAQKAAMDANKAESDAAEARLGEARKKLRAATLGQ